MKYSAKALIKNWSISPGEVLRRWKKNAWPRFIGRTTLSRLGLDTYLSAKIMTRSPLFVMRPGGTELEVVEHYLHKRLARPSQMLVQLRNLARHPPPTPRIDSSDYGLVLFRGEMLAGISPATATNHDEFAAEYLRCIGNSDLLVTYYWTAWICSIGLAENKPNISNKDFSPWERAEDGDSSWLASLAGLRVLVISPFEESIRQQYARKETISIVRDLLPDFDLIGLRPPVTFAGAKSSSSWYQELENVKKQMDNLKFDVVLTSAGAYGAPLAEYGKRLGKIGIHVGGELQTWFGISGKRWRDDPYSLLNNAGDLTNWILPSASETPPDSEAVEGGAYW